MNYFELYNLPESFFINAKELKIKYIEMSKKVHPDFFTLSSVEEKERTLDLSTLNNEAFRTLSDRDKRIAYILKLKGLLDEDKKPDVPQAFLHDMMDINERIMELDLSDADDHEKGKRQVILEIEKIESNLNTLTEEDMRAFDSGKCDDICLQRIKKNYLKSKYIRRIKNRLDQ